jgi:hypothetical protein
MRHVAFDKRQQRRKARSWIAGSGKLDDDTQRVSSQIAFSQAVSLTPGYCRGASLKVKANKGRPGMKELLRSNDAVLISYVSALLEAEGIAFIVADTNMSVLEGSIGALPRRVLVETDGAERARHILVEAGIGHVIPANDET